MAVQKLKFLFFVKQKTETRRWTLGQATDLLPITQASRALVHAPMRVAVCHPITCVDSCNQHHNQDSEQRSLMLSLYSNAMPRFSFSTSPPPQTLAITNLSPSV